MVIGGSGRVCIWRNNLTTTTTPYSYPFISPAPHPVESSLADLLLMSYSGITQLHFHLGGVGFRPEMLLWRVFWGFFVPLIMESAIIPTPWYTPSSPHPQTELPPPPVTVTHPEKSPSLLSHHSLRELNYKCIAGAAVVRRTMQLPLPPKPHSWAAVQCLEMRPCNIRRM